MDYAMLLDHAIRHIRRNHMNTRTWTLPIADEQAISILEQLKANYERKLGK